MDYQYSFRKHSLSYIRNFRLTPSKNLYPVKRKCSKGQLQLVIFSVFFELWLKFYDVIIISTLSAVFGLLLIAGVCVATWCKVALYFLKQIQVYYASRHNIGPGEVHNYVAGISVVNQALHYPVHCMFPTLYPGDCQESSRCCLQSPPQSHSQSLWESYSWLANDIVIV